MRIPEKKTHAKNEKSSTFWEFGMQKIALGFGSRNVSCLDCQVYTGNCKQFPEGEKRHGIGTYVASPAFKVCKLWRAQRRCNSGVAKVTPVLSGRLKCWGLFEWNPWCLQAEFRMHFMLCDGMVVWCAVSACIGISKVQWPMARGRSISNYNAGSWFYVHHFHLFHGRLPVLLDAPCDLSKLRTENTGMASSFIATVVCMCPGNYGMACWHSEASAFAMAQGWCMFMWDELRWASQCFGSSKALPVAGGPMDEQSEARLGSSPGQQLPGFCEAKQCMAVVRRLCNEGSTLGSWTLEKHASFCGISMHFFDPSWHSSKHCLLFRQCTGARGTLAACKW